MTTNIEPILEEEIGKETNDFIMQIVKDVSLDIFIENNKKGVLFSTCFIINNIILSSGKKVDLLAHHKYESITRNKYKLTFGEFFLFEEMEDDILDKINEFNNSNKNKVFYLDLDLKENWLYDSDDWRGKIIFKD